MKSLQIRDFVLGFTLVAMTASIAPAQEVMTKQYENGGVYEGQFRDGKQHGQGRYSLPSGYEYEGTWVEGRIEGAGQARYPNGSTYIGQFHANKPHGTGQITFADGSTYEGARARSPAQAFCAIPTARSTVAASPRACPMGSARSKAPAIAMTARGGRGPRTAPARSPMPMARSTRASFAPINARAKASW